MCARVVSLPFPIRQELAVVGHHHAIPVRVFNLLNVHFKVDGAHNPVAEKLMNQGLDGRPIDLGNLLIFPSDSIT
jgi:hypothetical protein